MQSLFVEKIPTSPECDKTLTTSTTTEVEIPINPDGNLSTPSHMVGFGGKTGSNAPSGSKCISDDPSGSTTTVDSPIIYPYSCIAEQISSEGPTCGTNVENDPNYYCHKYTQGHAAGENEMHPCE